MRTALGALGLAAGLVLLPAGLSWTAAAEESYQGSETCAMCHEETVTDFGKTAHATAPTWNAETGCEQCHGPGEAHVESGEGDHIVRFGDLSPRKASEACLTCHKEDHGRAGYKRSLHSLSDIGCIDCHDPHSPDDSMLPKSGTELCATCHQSIVGQFALPRSHPLSSADDGCANCHDPHGTNNARKFRRFGNETCTECHAEKAGPFVYEHDVSIVDGCRACHQVHGSPNRHLLAHSNQINLCYQCHPGTQTPSFHSAQSFLNEKCTACHTAIHGSNTHPYFLEE